MDNSGFNTTNQDRGIPASTPLATSYLTVDAALSDDRLPISHDDLTSQSDMPRPRFPTFVHTTATLQLSLRQLRHDHDGYERERAYDDGTVWHASRSHHSRPGTGEKPMDLLLLFVIPQATIRTAKRRLRLEGDFDNTRHSGMLHVPPGTRGGANELISMN